MMMHLIMLSLLIIAVIVIRACFRWRISPCAIYALWLAVLLKACLPVSFFFLPLTLPAFPGASSALPPTEVSVPSGESAQDTPTLPSFVDTESVESVVPDNPSEITPGESGAMISPGVTAPDTIDSEGNHDAANDPVRLQRLDLLRLLGVIWAGGAVFFALWFVSSALLLHIRVMRNRRCIGRYRALRVYSTDALNAPCLFGLIPAIYLTRFSEASDQRSMILRHEYMHFRHGDFLWTPIRILFVCAYWWNPLAWVAAFLSRRDAELACDAAVTSGCTEEERLSYANMIVDMIPQKHFQPNALSGGLLKERILMLTKKHSAHMIAAILAVFLTLGAVGCSFIGLWPSESQDTDPDHGGSGTKTPEIRVLSNDGNLTLRYCYLPDGEGSYTCYRYDERYLLWITYTTVDPTQPNDRSYTLRLFDLQEGKVTDSASFSLKAVALLCSYEDNGCVLFARGDDEMTEAYHILVNAGVMTVTAVQGNHYPYRLLCASSADKRAYLVVKDIHGNMEIVLKEVGGIETTVATGRIDESQFRGSHFTGFNGKLQFLPDGKLAFAASDVGIEELTVIDENNLYDLDRADSASVENILIIEPAEDHILRVTVYRSGVSDPIAVFETPDAIMQRVFMCGDVITVICASDEQSTQFTIPAKSLQEELQRMADLGNDPGGTFTLEVTGLKEPLRLKISEGMLLEASAFGHTLETKPVPMMGNCDFSVFEADHAVIFQWNDYYIGDTYVFSPEGTTAWHAPNYQPSFGIWEGYSEKTACPWLFLNEEGKLCYRLTRQDYASIVQTGALSCAVSRDDFLYAWGYAHVENGNVTMDNVPVERFTVSDVYDLDREFALMYSASYSSIEEVFERNRSFYFDPDVMATLLPNESAIFCWYYAVPESGVYLFVERHRTDPRLIFLYAVDLASENPNLIGAYDIEIPATLSYERAVPISAAGGDTPDSCRLTVAFENGGETQTLTFLCSSCSTFEPFRLEA